MLKLSKVTNFKNNILYKIGKYRQFGNLNNHYSLKKKYFFGWKEIAWWHDNPEGRIKKDKAVESIIKNGHIIIEE